MITPCEPAPPVSLERTLNWFGYALYDHPGLALCAAQRLAHLTGERCIVCRCGFSRLYRVVRLDSEGREVEQS